MFFDEIIWPLLILLVTLIGLWRANSFFVRLGLVFDWVGKNLGDGFAIALRIIAVLLMGFIILYFIITSVQMIILKPAVFHRCLPEKSMPERLVKCFVGNPYKHIKKSSR